MPWLRAEPRGSHKETIDYARPGAGLVFSLLERPEFQCGEELGALQDFSITQEPGHMVWVHFSCLSFRAQRVPRAKRVTDHNILFSLACGHTSPNHPLSPHGFSRSSLPTEGRDQAAICPMGPREQDCAQHKSLSLAFLIHIGGEEGETQEWWRTEILESFHLVFCVWNFIDQCS